MNIKKTNNIKSRLFFIIVVFIACCSVQNLIAQNRTISGRVISYETKKLLPDIKLKLRNLDVTTQTNDKGQYTLSIPDTLTIIEFEEIGSNIIKETIFVSNEIIDVVISNEALSIFQLGIEDLFDLKVVSASNTEEKINDAPAKVLVISKNDIQTRGYSDIVEIFIDLPEIDLSLTFGDLYMKPYWRGMRKGLSSPFLLMLDGKNMNHLWYNWSDVAVAVPLSNIERIEVVYGPASSVYGANALMGVFNIITQKDKKENGSNINARYSYGDFKTRVADVNFFYKKEDFRVSGTCFVNQGDLDLESIERFEYTKSKYLTDRALWGGFVDNEEITGAGSPRNNQAFVLNTFYKNTELGMQYYRVDNGNGLNYAADRTHSKNKWIEPELNFYLQHKQEFGKKVSTTSLVRYRESNISNESTALEYNNSYGELREISYVRWQSLNRAISVSQIFDTKISEGISLLFGLQYEYKDLQKAYDLPRGPILEPKDVDASAYDYPIPPERTFNADNRTIWRTESAYLQGKFNLTKLFDFKYPHIFHLGFRVDDNSYYGLNPTFRAAYTFAYKKFNVKLLYGESFQEPTPRQLYGGWSGSGSSPNLDSETSQTGEISINYIRKNLHVNFGTYYNRIENMIIDLEAAPKNIGKLDVVGADVMTNYSFKTSFIDKGKAWAYVSYTATNEQKFDMQGNKTKKDDIGDIAPIKIQAGLSLHKKNFYANIRTRFISERETVETNQIETVDGFFTTDVNIGYRNFILKGITASMKITNLFDAEYYHPGIRMANSGNTPAYFEKGLWYGSQGWSNSLLPQPGRCFVFSLSLNI